MMSFVSLLASSFLAITQLAAAPSGPVSDLGPERARLAFDAARDAAADARSSWSSFEVMGCVSVWQVWKDISGGALASPALARALPELSASNAARMEMQWREQLEQISLREGISLSAYQRDLTDRFNFELAEAREALGGTHAQPELVFGAAGACQL